MSKISKSSLQSIATIIDQIGAMQAQIAPLEKKLKGLKGLKDDLKAYGVGKHEGTLYDATVFAQVRDILDMDAVRAKLSAQFIVAHTRQSESVVCKVTAKQIGNA